MKRKKLMILFVVLLLAIGLAACRDSGGDGDAQSAGGGEGALPPTVSATQAGPTETPIVVMINPNFGIVEPEEEEQAEGETEEQTGSISGQVLASDGETPLADVQVIALLEGVETGDGANTDEQGNFTIAGLPGGNYLVAVTLQDGVTVIYHPGVQTEEEATLVEVTVPDETGELVIVVPES